MQPFDPLAKLKELLTRTEKECLEFKEAKNNYDTNELGKYFSALSNEANLKVEKAAWLLFGVHENQHKKPHKVVGTNYRSNDKQLQATKNQIAKETIGDHTFVEIFSVLHHDGRVVMFQIPPAPRGMPVPWKGTYYGRHGDSLSKLAEYEKEHFLKQEAQRDLEKIDEVSKERIENELNRHRPDNFSGRKTVIHEIEEFIKRNDRGMVFVEGPPGNGKSALIAYLFHHFRDRRPAPLAFFFSPDYVDRPDDCLWRLNVSLLLRHELVKTNSHVRPTSAVGHQERFLETLRGVASNASRESPQILLVDALDQSRNDAEGNTPVELLKPVLRDLPKHVYIILTSRTSVPIQSCPPVSIDLNGPDWKNENLRDGEVYASHELSDLSLSNVTISRIAQVCDGNFLVLTLFCREIRRRAGNVLQSEIDGILSNLASRTESDDQLGWFYKTYLDRMLAGCSSNEYDNVTKVLQVLTVVRSHVTSQLIMGAANLAFSTWERARGQVVEFVYAIPSEEKSDERLRFFHETMKSFLTTKFRAGIVESHKLVANYCANWPTFTGIDRKYALRFLPYHLAEAKKWDQLDKLLTDLSFIRERAHAGVALDEFLDDYEKLLEHYGAATPEPIFRNRVESTSDFSAFDTEEVLSKLRMLSPDQRVVSPSSPPANGAIPERFFGNDRRSVAAIHNVTQNATRGLRNLKSLRVREFAAFLRDNFEIVKCAESDDEIHDIAFNHAGNGVVVEQAKAAIENDDNNHDLLRPRIERLFRPEVTPVRLTQLVGQRFTVAGVPVFSEGILWPVDENFMPIESIVRSMHGDDPLEKFPNAVCLAVSGDGRRLLEVQENGSVRLWNLATRSEPKLLSTFQGKLRVLDSLWRIGLSFDGSYAVR